MSNAVANVNSDKTKYSKMLSSLFCSVSMFGLSLLCLLNNLSFDIYSACMLLKVVIPGSFCFWFLGYSMGHILDAHGNAKPVVLASAFGDDSSNKAYEIPSMFAQDSAQTDNELGDL